MQGYFSLSTVDKKRDLVLRRLLKTPPKPRSPRQDQNHKTEARDLDENDTKRESIKNRD
jgi:hypothetical protein